ncbi:hypothetical protein B5G50_02045 [Brevibacillus brevis]|nr:hypothetical protein B5G50_02045 [Brevibacillus brevis]
MSSFLLFEENFTITDCRLGKFVAIISNFFCIFFRKTLKYGDKRWEYKAVQEYLEPTKLLAEIEHHPTSRSYCLWTERKYFGKF